MDTNLKEKISKSLSKDKTILKNITDQTWEVIYSYFKNHPRWMARHQLDSYNDFIHNNIPRIFKQKGYYKVISYRGDYSHIFEIYLGGKEHNKIRISHPTIYDHQSGNMRPLYPNEARLRNLTYGFDLFYDVDVVLNVYQGDNNEKHIIKDYTFPDADFLKDIYLGNIPIMLHSDVCSLNKIPKANLHQYGENPDEPGGYLILDGAEKVLLCQQRKAENMIFLSKIKSSQSDRYIHQALIKSKHDAAFEFARDNCLYMEKTGELVMRIGPIGKEFIRTMSAPEFPGYNNKYIPVFVLFRYLGIESDKEIVEMICGDLETDLGKKLSNELIPSIQDKVIMQYNIYDKQGAELLLSKLERTRTQLSGGRELKDISRNKVQTLAYLHQSIRLNFLPHAGEEHRQKAYYLAYMIRRLLLNYLEIDEDGNTSLDTFMAKRIDTGGYLLSTLFRTAFIEGILYNIRRQIDSILELNHDMRGPDAINVINENSYRSIFSVEAFNKYFTSKLKVGVFGNKTGVVQQLERVNYFSVISHLRRIVDPTFGGKSTVTDERRQLNTTQFGFLCPNESPEGGNIGLRQALSILTTISIGYPTKQLKQWCYKNGVIPLTYNTNLNNHEQVKVFVNGCWLGCHPDPISFIKVFKLFRRNGLINATTSIAFHPLVGEIQIYCDDGRLVRPVYCVENNELLVTDKEFRAVYENKLLFDNLCTSRLLLNNNKLNQWDLRDVNVYSPKRLGLVDDDKELLEKLELNQAMVEYIDPYESDTLLINLNLPMPDIMELEKSKLSYTHSEIHPSTMLGFMAHVSPCTHHSQGGKYLASGGTKHPKQSLSVYHPCHDTRFDTGKIFLAHNVERPIVHGRMNTKINHHKWGTGQNVIIAIAYYNEDNQEDGFVFNKSSVDMGLFHASYYKKYEAFETIDEKTGLEERFYNPYYRTENENYPESLDENHGSYTFEHLDKFGFVKEGTYLTGNEVLIGKFLKVKNAFGEESYEDLSTHVKKDNKESYVDKVFTCTTNSKGMRLCKVRTCQFRKPEHGDKFACYTDKTEVLTTKGWKSIKDVTLKDKVAVLKNDNYIFEHPEDLIEYDYNGKLYNLESQQVEITVTPNHRMYIKKRNKSEYEILEAKHCFGKRIKYKKNVNNYKPLKWLGNKFLIPEYKYGNKTYDKIYIDMNDWLTFFGIWIAEGYVNKGNNNVVICANKQRVKDALDTCTSINNNFKFNKYNNDKWIICNCQLANYMRKLSVGAINKYLPNWVWRLNKSQSQVLMASLELGDGFKSKSNNRTYYTSSKQLADDISRLCLQAGYSTNIRVPKGREKDSLHKFKREKIIQTVKTNADNYCITIIKTKVEPQINHGHTKTQNGQKESWIDYKGKVYCLTVSTGVFYVRQNGKPIWCGNSRNGQKGTIGLMIPQEDMPFTDDGLVPDILLHPSSYPKRMTVSQLIEPIFAELGINMGFFPQANTMEKIEMSEVIKIMENAGVSYCGDKVLYSGVYGNQMKSAIFMAPLYFQRSILQTRDKINARSGEHRVDGIPVPGGGYTAKERQVVSGRANGGGVKIGEMERDSLLSHGITSFINERDTTRGDKFYVYVSPVTGEMMIGNPDDKIFFDNSVDGPVSFHLKEGTGQGRKHIIGPNMFHKKQNKFVKVQIPYAMKLNIHDFMGMGMSVRLKPEVRKLVYDKYMAGEEFENLLMEYDDIIQQQDAKMEEYLQQSLVEQLAKEKAESKLSSQETDDETLQDINEQVEAQREEKLNALSALNQPELAQDQTQHQYALNDGIPHPFNPLQTPDVGNFTLDGVDTKTSFGGQDFGVINLNKQQPKQAINNIHHTNNTQQLGGFNNQPSNVDSIDTNLPNFNDIQSGGAELGDYINSSTFSNLMFDSSPDVSMDSVPSIGFSELDDMELGIDNISTNTSMDVQTGGYIDSSLKSSLQQNNNSGDVKQVVFEASEKEKSAMGL